MPVRQALSASSQPPLAEHPSRAGRIGTTRETDCDREERTMCDTDHYASASKGIRRGDDTVGITRRQSLTAAAGVVGVLYAIKAGPLAMLSTEGTPAAAAASCVLTPEKTEGPYFVDELLNRSDLRSDSDGSSTQAGVPLTLTINVTNEDDGCSVGEGVIVDVWHANAGGDYSDIAANTQENTLGHDWLRGYQVTDSKGQVTFKTIYPGWYEGRTVHIHFKVRAFDGDETTYEFTSQLFFEQSINDAVETSSGYEGVKSVTNSTDGIYSGDTELLVPLTGSVANGYTGEITVGLSGLPETSDDPDPSGDDEVEARLVRARAERTAAGRRRVVARIDAEERVSVKLRLTRRGEVLAKGSGRAAKGKHDIGLRVPAGVVAGDARLSAVLEDRAGNVRTQRRRVKVPRVRR